MPLVGERWATGQWTIAEEHLASRTLLRALERVRPPMGPERRVGPLAVLAGVAGEQHMIGLVCLEQVLAEDGWTVANLGADLPAADLGAFVGAQRRGARGRLRDCAGSPRRPLADAVRAVRAAAGGRPDPGHASAGGSRRSRAGRPSTRGWRDAVAGRGRRSPRPWPARRAGRTRRTLPAAAQTETGSRYSPKTSRSTRHCSPSVA